MAIMSFIGQIQGAVEGSVSVFARSKAKLKKLVERQKKPQHTKNEMKEFNYFLPRQSGQEGNRSFIFLYPSVFHPTPFQNADKVSS